MNELPTLIATVGPPRCGKSTWAKAQGHPVVNPDAIRLAIHGQDFVASAEPYVWAVAETMVRSLFGAGHPTVILDATNVTRSRRAKWKSKDWVTKFRVFNETIETCLYRAHAGGRPDLVPVIGRMFADFEPLDETDGLYTDPPPPWKSWKLVGKHNWPRRRSMDYWTPAEKAIFDALQAVEAAGAHTLLTDAVILLGKAQDKVADFVELPPPEPAPLPACA